MFLNSSGGLEPLGAELSLKTNHISDYFYLSSPSQLLHLNKQIDAAGPCLF